MKGLFFLTSALFLFVCFGLYAADEMPQNSAESLALPPLIFDTVNGGGLFSSGLYLKEKNFLLLDGTYLNYKEMRSRLIAIPGNEKYVHRAKGFEVMGLTGACVGIAGFISYIVFSFIPDLPSKKVFEVAGLGVGMLGAWGCLAGFTNSHENLHYATQNYNLSVMGIPIPDHF